jgi:arabinose-5-phosphate isomerase
MNMLERARHVFEIEARAIMDLGAKLTPDFEKAVDLMYQCKERVVLTGMGKAGIVARKIAATLASTGTPAFYMHPAEGVHGDLGMVTPDNVVLAISHNGNTEEILRLIPYIKHFKIKLIAMTGNLKSELARQSDVVLDISVKEEACPLGLTPTASTTAALAMGDALAVVLLEKRNFRAEHFAIFHPGGTLGRRLLIKVEDLMHSGEYNPVISKDNTLKEGIIEMTSKGLGATSIVDERGILLGILTDGDLRRILHAGKYGLDTPLQTVMIRTPKTTTRDTLGVKAIDLMEQYNITVLPVIDEERRPIGMIHLHDLIKAGITP